MNFNFNLLSLIKIIIMVSEIIWSLVGVVWLLISVYIAYLVLKYGSQLFKKMVGETSFTQMGQMLDEFKKINRHLKK